MNCREAQFRLRFYPGAREFHPKSGETLERPPTAHLRIDIPGGNYVSLRGNPEEIRASLEQRIRRDPEFREWYGGFGRTILPLLMHRSLAGEED